MLVHQEWTDEDWKLTGGFVDLPQVLVGGHSETDVLVEHIESRIDAKDTELIGVCAKPAYLACCNCLSLAKTTTKSR